MDRLELVPGDVRGGGNITLPKSPDFRSDKNTSMCDTYLTERFVPIAENDFQYVYRSISSNGLHIVCDAPRRVSSGDSVTVNVSVLRNDSIVSGASVSLLLRGMDGTVFYEDTVTIDSSQPVFTVSVPEGTGIFCEWFVRAYHVDYQGVNFRQEVMVDTGLDFDFNVVGDKDTIQIGETANIVGVLTGTSGDDVIGIPGQTVNFYELWTPGLRTSVTPPVIQVGDTSNIKVQLIDTVDGSLVREAGHTVNVYMEDVPRVPTTLDVNIDKTILSYADGDKANITLTLYDQFNEPVAGEYISFYLDGELRTRFRTNGDGQVTGLSYRSTGVGDVVLGFECGNLQETYSIEDCFAYRETGSQAHNTGSTQHFYPLFDLTNIGDYEITGEISATTGKGFSVGFNKPTDWTDDNFARVMVDGAGYDGSYCKVNGNLQYDAYSTQYTANTYFAFKFKYENGVLTLTHKSRDWTPQVPLEPCTFGFGGWNNDKTINYRNLKIKPL